MPNDINYNMLIAGKPNQYILHLVLCSKNSRGGGGWEVGVRPSKRLMGMCRWMGSHFHNWIDWCVTQFDPDLSFFTIFFNQKIKTYIWRNFSRQLKKSTQLLLVCWAETTNLYLLLFCVNKEQYSLIITAHAEMRRSQERAKKQFRPSFPAVLKKYANYSIANSWNDHYWETNVCFGISKS